MSFALFAIAAALFSGKRLLAFLRFLQQDSYDPRRFLGWLYRRRAFDTKGASAIAAAVLLLPLYPAVAPLVASALLFLFFLFEKDPRTCGKLKLVMTERAKRIFFCAFALMLLAFAPIFLTAGIFFWLLALLAFQCLPLFLPAALLLLSYDERRRQKRFLEEARAKLADAAPFVIGITGSYGKTSTKEALGSILQMALGPTFWPGKGVNTDMGIVQELRSRLKKGVRYAVVEMAAYGPGSIRRLCGLTPPQAGIITCIGLAHLERFGGKAKIKETKAELAQALPEEGILVCNGDNAGARAIAGEFPKKTTLLYGFDNARGDLDCWVKEWRCSGEKTHFVIAWKQGLFAGTMPLLGKAALSNIAGCFALAAALGADPELLLGAIANLKPVDNRLQLQHNGGVAYLRDAYNSNPEGFSDALEVLATLEAKAKVLMTPGMVELAGLQQQLHQEIGSKAAAVCSHAIVVGSLNRDSLTQGLIAGGMARESITHVEGRDQAFNVLNALITPGDAVLIENDLPDLYQERISF